MGRLTPEELLDLNDALVISDLAEYESEFLALYEMLDSEGRAMVNGLTRRMLHRAARDYPHFGDRLVTSIFSILPATLQRVVLMPLVDPVDKVKPKSGDLVAYALRGRAKASADSIGAEFELRSGSLSSATRANLDQSTFLLVDDFVGTGDSALKAIRWLCSLGVHAKSITVGAFVGMRRGRDAIIGAGATPVFLDVVDRGISDAIDIQDKTGCLSIMARIESSKGVVGKYRFGYNASEALVMMMYCPNNTFPVFWWNGPLPR